MSIIKKTLTARDTTDGDGVSLKRVFGYHEKEVFDPFLLLDHAEASFPQNGFPWHPHRGIETITYCIKGEITHEDTLGNKGTLDEGDIQWMKSGSGILHEEIPNKNSKEFEIIQLWLNMPSSNKMDNPEYNYMNVSSENIIKIGDSQASVIAGSYNGAKGSIQYEERKIKLVYFNIEKDNPVDISRTKGTNSFIYVLSGNGLINNEVIKHHNVYQLGLGEITIETKSNIKLVFAEGAALNETIEWYGPIVMNTKEEIKQARIDLRNDTFIKYRGDLS